jgi:general secretion pathway protein H
VTARGFTLLELLVVLVVMSLLIAAVPLVMSGGVSALALKAEARDVADAMRHARGRAIAINEEVVFSLDADSGRYAVTPGRRAGVLSEGTEAFMLPKSAAGTVRFFPDGGSTGGRITISKDRRRYELRIDWLTGQITVAE